MLGALAFLATSQVWLETLGRHHYGVLMSTTEDIKIDLNSIPWNFLFKRTCGHPMFIIVADITIKPTQKRQWLNFSSSIACSSSNGSPFVEPETSILQRPSRSLG